MNVYHRSNLNDLKMSPPGEMVDIGGLRLHAIVRGQGGPTVVLEPALGGYALQYSHIQSAVSAFTRVVAYDRAGQGWSDVSSDPRTPGIMAGELKRLLNRLDLQPPFILASHSFGGLLTRIYAGLYPQEVAGMVLIDATHVKEYAPFPDVDKNVRQMATMVRLMKFVSRLGLGKPLTRLGLGPEGKSFSSEELNTYLALASQPKHYETMLAEFSQHRSYYGDQSQVPGTLGNMPLVIVTAGKSVSGQAKIGGSLTGDQMNALHQHLQKDLVQLSTQAEQVILPEATHFSIFLHPKHAVQVVEAIRQMVERVRSCQSTTHLNDQSVPAI